MAKSTARQLQPHRCWWPHVSWSHAPVSHCLPPLILLPARSHPWVSHLLSICWNLLDCASHMYLMVTLDSAISHPKSSGSWACSGLSTSPSLHTSWSDSRVTTPLLRAVSSPSCLCRGSIVVVGGCSRAPRSQAHGESCFVSHSSEVHFHVFHEPPIHFLLGAFGGKETNPHPSTSC